LPGFDSFVCDLLGIEKVRIVLAGSTAEGTEFAPDKTDVGEVDVAIHDVSDEVAGEFAAEFVGGDEESEEIIAFGVRKKQGLFVAENATVERCQDIFESFANRRAEARRDFRPVERREGLQFGVGQRSGHGVLLRLFIYSLPK
jgi:precorrin-6B methylase 2